MAEKKPPFHETVAQNLIEQLKAGTAPWQKPWDPGAPGFMPTNPLTGNRYKGINAIHLMAQGRSDNRWMTYKQAKELGAQVRGKEKGTGVQYWKFTEERTKLDANGKPVTDDKGKPVKETIQLERPRVFFATVFNGEQIDGLPPLERKEQTWDASERAEKILNASGADIRHGGDRAFYRPSSDHIQLPDKGQFPTADNYYSTALHELQHWTGHNSRLDRDLAHPFGSEGYAREELRAEIGSMILGDELGIGHDPEQHAAYVGSWIKALQDDPLEIFRASAEAEKMSNYVLAFEQKLVQEQDQTQSQKQEAAPEQTHEAGMQLPINNQRQQALLKEAVEAEIGVPVFGVRDSVPVDWTGEARVHPVVMEGSYEAGDLEDRELRPGETPTHWRVEAKDSQGQWHWFANPLDEQEGREIAKQLNDIGNRFNGQAQPQKQEAAPEQAQEAGMQLPTNNQQMRDQLLSTLSQDDSQALSQVANERRRLVAGETDVQAFEETARQALGFDLPADWNGAIQVQGNVIIEDGGEQFVEPAQAVGREPEFWGVYAQHENGMHQWVADLNTQEQAEELATLLGVVDALSEPNEHEQTAKFARVNEMRVRLNPNSSDDDILAAKETRKSAEMAAMLNDDDLQRRIAEFEQQEQQPQQQPTSVPTQVKEEKTFINVPYKEKNEAKGLGAKWDGDQRSWYVPPGVDINQFSKWTAAGSGSKETVQSSSQPQPKKDEQSRQYLAVPYGERAAAKSAGAAWDKTAKSWYVGPNGDMERLNRWLPSKVQNQQDPAMTPKEEFGEALRSLGCEVDGEHPIMDGKKHRIRTTGDKKGVSHSAGSGFYVGHLDGHPAGYIRNNRTGIDMKWKSKGYALSPEEKAKLQAEAAEKLATRAKEQERLQNATANRVSRQAATLVPATEKTPYQERKNIQSLPGVLTDSEGKKTYIPLNDVNGKQWTMQYIQEDGTKRFAKDSKKEGCFHIVGGDMKSLESVPAIVLHEGYATAATNTEALGFPTVATFDAGNLPVVAKALKEVFPDKPMVIFGDDDRHQELMTGVNPGKEKAREAAKAVGGTAAFPIFAPGEAEYPADLPKVTPQMYREHCNAKRALENAPEDKQAEIKKSLLSDEQVSAIDNLYRHTDYNDLANNSRLGKEGVERQVRATVSKAIQEHDRKRENKQVLQQEEVQKQKRAARIN